VASRGHHADVGGAAPGSMTPRATLVDEEGVLIDNFKLVDGSVEGGRFRERSSRAPDGPPYPARNPAQNIADLKAQIAANEKGVIEIRKMVREFGLEVVQAYMRHVRDNAAESVRRVIETLKDSEFEYPTDQGSVIRSGSPSTRRAARPRSISPAPRPRSPTTSMRRPRSPAPPCFMPSASWSKAISR
jgi:5-oxoprolinase (ATP-hydrolysing)